MPTRREWEEELDRLSIPWNRGVAIRFPAPLRSWAWYLAVEPGRHEEFKTVVIQWTRAGEPPNLRQILQAYPSRVCGTTDRSKGWLHRFRLSPPQLEEFLSTLRREAGIGPWPVEGEHSKEPSRPELLPAEYDDRGEPLHALALELCHCPRTQCLSLSPLSRPKRGW